MKLIGPILIILLSSSAFAKLTRFDVYGSKKHEYEYKTVCDNFGIQDAPLIEPEGVRQLDCMGKDVKVLDYCLKQEFPSENLLRGYVDTKKEKVVCQTGSRLVLSFACGKGIGSRKYCKDSKHACEILRDTFAVKLKIGHHYLTKPEDNIKSSATLFCNFVAKEDDPDSEKIIPSIY